ncbi:class I adenylate-forming enzyme family protein [Streptomyces avermitilis]|uniref:class I adenylate-forming enzyme family protein n=1 Tax=Streptomyces avermitilis TaxID=33903 RepID=UPI0033AEB2FF
MRAPLPTLSPAEAGTSDNLAAVPADRAERRGRTGRPAFRQGHQVRPHGAVHDLAARTATVLAEHGVRPGDRVLLARPDSLAWVTAFLASVPDSLATARLGAVAVPVTPELTPAEHECMADDVEAALCVTGPGPKNRFAHRRRLGADQPAALTRTASPAADAHPAGPRTPLYIQYTSGTTGSPKGVVPSAVLVDGRPTPATVDGLVARHRVTLLLLRTVGVRRSRGGPGEQAPYGPRNGSPASAGRKY